MNDKNSKHWYALYTTPRSEKKVLERLMEAGIEAYLPIIKKQRQWSDRKRWVEVPLFYSYIFVCISKAEYYNVLKVSGIVRYITFEGKAVIIPESQIDRVRKMIESGYEMEVTDEQFLKGDKVKITNGPLMDIEGLVIDFRGNHKLMLRVEHIGQSILLNVPMNLLKKIN